MDRMSPSEQLANHAITQEVADDARETREEFRRLDKRIAELEAALKPFADFYAPAMELAGDDHKLTNGSSMARRQITVGNVRRAYEALSR